LVVIEITGRYRRPMLLLKVVVAFEEIVNVCYGIHWLQRKLNGCYEGHWLMKSMVFENKHIQSHSNESVNQS
jgi:hypothetical protein